MVDLSLVLVGCIGGLLPEVLRLVRARHDRRLPKYLGYLGFWLGVILMSLLGGLASWVLGAQGLKDALAYGFAAPEIFSRLSATTATDVDRGAGEFRLRTWWAN